MPRTFSRNSQFYNPGTYGPFSIDAFTKNDADEIEVTLTVENWPVVETVAVLTLTANNGAQMTVNVPGQPKNRDGTPATVFRARLGFPADDGVVRDTSNATLSAEVLSRFRTAITLRAV